MVNTDYTILKIEKTFQNLLLFVKFWIFLVVICLVFINGFSFGYQNEGFVEYQEGEEGISFKCDGICSILLGEVGESDYLNINGTIGGTGKFLVLGKTGYMWNTLYQELFSPIGSTNILFSDYQVLLDGMSGDGLLGIHISGNFEGDLKVDRLSFTSLQKILKVLKEFWKMETFNYGGMNFRNGVSMGGHSIVEYGYVLFILAVISILIISLVFKKLKKEKIFKLIFYVGLCMFLFIGFRNIINGTVLLKQGLSGFRDNYNLFQLKDYIGFVVKVRNKLHLDDFEKNDCKIFIKSDKLLYNWAVDLHGEYFFEPCERVYSSDLADYVLYAGVEIEAEDYGKDVLVEHNGRYLLDNRMK